MPSSQDLHPDIQQLIKEVIRERGRENVPAIGLLPSEDFTAALVAFSQRYESRIDQSHGAPDPDQLIRSNAPLDTTPAQRIPVQGSAFNAMITLMAKTDHFWFGCEKKKLGWEVSARLPLVMDETTAKNQATELARRLGISDPLTWELCSN